MSIDRHGLQEIEVEPLTDEVIARYVRQLDVMAGLRKRLDEAEALNLPEAEMDAWWDWYNENWSTQMDAFRDQDEETIKALEDMLNPPPPPPPPRQR